MIGKIKLESRKYIQDLDVDKIFLKVYIFFNHIILLRNG